MVTISSAYADILNQCTPMEADLAITSSLKHRRNRTIIGRVSCASARDSSHTEVDNDREKT
jgi:hypothetical protein